VRLYSIASSRYGDAHDGKTCTLCVVRVVYKDAAGNEVRRLPAGTAMLPLWLRAGKAPERRARV
jgi:hypothetical protein